MVVGANSITIDGGNYTITGNSGRFDYGIDNTGGYDNITIKNFANITNFNRGISLSNTTNSVIQNITANSNVSYGIYLDSSSNNLTGNTASSNEYGIYLYYFSSSNTITGNIVSKNRWDILDYGSNTYTSNQFNNNIASKMLTFSETTRTKNVGDTTTSSISAFNPDGTDCNGCTTITTSPSETVTIDSESGNDITGHFIPTKSGTYSLNFTVTDTNSNTTKRNYLFFVGNTATITPPTTYYLRGVYSTHGQQVKRRDSESLLLSAPTTTEVWWCTDWVQNSQDQLPDYPLANLSAIDTYTWYKQSAESGAYIGVERDVTYGVHVDSDSSVAAAADYTWINKNFAGINWAMDYPHNW